MVIFTYNPSLGQRGQITHQKIALPFFTYFITDVIDTYRRIM